ncbi:MAG: SapC family protein [Novosphingobium sp.]|nr:SapC family protein [Novosphingobium sp.]
MEEKLELLDSAVHGDLRMHRLGGRHPHIVQIVLPEVERAAATCPVLLAKSPDTGRFSLVALFGFSPDEILAETDDSGSPAFVPLELARQGFYAVEQNIAVDVAHPRFAAGGPIALFNALGDPTDETRVVQQAIGRLMAMGPPTEAFIEAMVALRLVEAIAIQLKFDDGSSVALNGLYTISGDALSALPDSDIIRLFRAGWMNPAMMIRASVHQIGAMARRKNQALASGPAAAADDLALGKALAGWA